jgi:hypothetical protein
MSHHQKRLAEDRPTARFDGFFGKAHGRMFVSGDSHDLSFP